MGLFDDLLRYIDQWLAPAPSPRKREPKRYATQAEIKQMQKVFGVRKEQIRTLFEQVLARYQARACPCAYPRFRQLAEVDCSKTGDSYTCHDTELLISMAKPGFEVRKTESNEDAVTQQWTCKTCGSVYDFGWSDFSIAIDRSRLRVVDLNVREVGLPAKQPQPVYLGVMGHSLPGPGEVEQVDYEVFADYMLES